MTSMPRIRFPQPRLRRARRRSSVPPRSRTRRRPGPRNTSNRVMLRPPPLLLRRDRRRPRMVTTHLYRRQSPSHSRRSAGACRSRRLHPSRPNRYSKPQKAIRFHPYRPRPCRRRNSLLPCRHPRSSHRQIPLWRYPCQRFWTQVLNCLLQVPLSRTQPPRPRSRCRAISPRFRSLPLSCSPSPSSSAPWLAVYSVTPGLCPLRFRLRPLPKQ